MLLTNPGDGVVGQVGVQVILRVIGWLDGFGALKERRMPLVSVAADETVEVFEAQPRRPEVEWPGLA